MVEKLKDSEEKEIINNLMSIFNNFNIMISDTNSEFSMDPMERLLKADEMLNNFKEFKDRIAKDIKDAERENKKSILIQKELQIIGKIDDKGGLILGKKYFVYNPNTKDVAFVVLGNEKRLFKVFSRNLENPNEKMNIRYEEYLQFQKQFQEQLNNSNPPNPLKPSNLGNLNQFNKQEMR